MTEVELARLTAALYAPKPGDFDRIIQTPWFVGIKRVGDSVVVVPRGSVIETDFIDDARSEFGRLVPGFEALGPLPSGFARELSTVVSQLSDEWAAETVIFSGHSLGASRACEIAGAYVMKTGKSTRVQALGCPRPGTSALEKVLAASAVKLYRNGMDPVWTVPFPIPELRWTHPGTKIALNEKPTARSTSDSFGGELWHSLPFIAWHRVDLYVRGIERLGT